MKSNIFKDVLEETVLEVNESKEQTIEKLRSQAGFCSTKDSDDDQVYFWCTKKGKIGFFSQLYRDRKPLFYYYNMDKRIYSVRGKVLSEEGKTVVKLYCVYSKLNWMIRLIDVIITILVLILFFTLKGITGQEIPGTDLLKLGGFLFLAALSTFVLTSEVHNKRSDLELMKQEVINRVEAIKTWNK